MAAQQIRYLTLEPLKDKPYKTAKWVSGIEQAYGFETNGDAQAVKGEYKDASGVEEGKDGRFYVMQVARYS
jgi:hypothetical protein